RYRVFFYLCSHLLRDLHSFPTRRSSDLLAGFRHMANQASLIEQEPLVVHTRPVIEMDDEQFFQFCQLNRDLQIERSSDGDIIIIDRKSTRLNSSHLVISYAVFCLKKKNL